VSPTREVRIEKLAPTGEGIARTEDGVGFVEGALPGERVATTLYEMRKRFWRGRTDAVLEPSPDRVEGPHAGCAGCDWAHFEPAAARRAKSALFLETMERIGRLDRASFGEPDVSASAPGYRLRTRLHAGGGRLGYHAPGSHRIVPADSCEAIAVATRALLPRVEEAAAESGAAVTEFAILESVDGSRRLARASAAADAAAAARLGEALAPLVDGVRVEAPDARPLVARGERALTLAVGGREYPISVDTFFQANRHLVGSLVADVRGAAGGVGPGDALDAFGGAGLFAGALLEAGHRVQTVEADSGAVADARRAREHWADGERWEIAGATVERFLEQDDRVFDCVVADPPRAGLGVPLARELARRTRRRLLYVSCDPATLARDLAALVGEGLAIARVRLYDLFAFTHRVEALVTLERAA
jgi:tRNA/tmRNA/rRNA uracil-C5-methylase (TrmA/RlmC/RlmD family)